MNKKRKEEGIDSVIIAMNDRKAQFFLIAAVVIIVVVVSIVTISNYTDKQDVVRLYDLGQELGIESQNVLDYGTYSQLNEEQMKVLMENFIKNYVSYIEEDKNIYFVFGNKNKINVVGYQEIANENVCVNITSAGITSPCVPYLIGQTQGFSATSGEISQVVIRIAETDYEFELTEGENFYFVIWTTIGGEKHVVTSNG
jgi:hypothetical protein